MKSFTNIILIILIAATAGYFGARYAPQAKKQGKATSVYERVMQAGKIRCGYTLYSVGLNRDANSGELWGIYKDVTEEIGRTLGLEIEWAEEVGWGQQVEGLNTNRYDLICSPVSVTGPRTKAADYTMPLYYSPVGIWVRRNDTRFDYRIMAINDPSIKISTMDGEQTDAMARTYFPEAARFSIPQSSDFSTLMLNVVTGKADVTFAEPFAVFEFMETNPNSLKNVTRESPLTLVPNIMLIKGGEHRFKSMLNSALTELFLKGYIDHTIDTFETYPDSYVRSEGYY